MPTEAQTIFAVASGRGPAGVAIIRISGSAASNALASLAAERRWTPRRATAVALRSPGGELLDHALALWFPRPASFTGEDVVELHVHGGRAVVGGVLEALGDVAGLRPAGPGEFTRRAFDNGKLDLTQAEALPDLVAAETAGQRRQALRQLEGVLGRLYEDWRARLLDAMIRVEAALDFADEDLPDGLEASARGAISALRIEIEHHLADGRRGERLRDGVSVVFIGAPNAGKSTLINALCGRGVSIVDDQPGTTRDVVEAALVLGGFPVVLADTAGLRDDGGRVEAEGVRRALARAADADVRVAVFDGALWPETEPRTLALMEAPPPAIAVVSKADLGYTAIDVVRIAGEEAVAVSAVTGAGLQELRRRLELRVAACCGTDGAPVLTRERHRRALEICVEALRRASARGIAPEAVAEDVRAAAAALGMIVGKVDVEDVLAGIFRQFCIGK